MLDQKDSTVTNIGEFFIKLISPEIEYTNPWQPMFFSQH